jgi:hypothetical protein
VCIFCPLHTSNPAGFTSPARQFIGGALSKNMKITLILSILSLITGCNSRLDKSVNAPKSNTASSALDTGILSLKKELSDKTDTIIVSYAAIACSCPQWFETKFQNIAFLEGVERFYLEPTNKDLINANSLWDGTHLPLTLEVVGTFSKEKEEPVMHQTKGATEKARIFWYEKITVLSDQ